MPGTQLLALRQLYLLSRVLYARCRYEAVLFIPSSTTGASCSPAPVVYKAPERARHSGANGNEVNAVEKRHVANGCLTVVHP